MALDRYLKDPKMIWNVLVAANNHVGIVCPSPDGPITWDKTGPMTRAHLQNWTRTWTGRHQLEKTMRSSSSGPGRRSGRRGPSGPAIGRCTAALEDVRPWSKEGKRLCFKRRPRDLPRRRSRKAARQALSRLTRDPQSRPESVGDRTTGTAFVGSALPRSHD